jgi:hypothetical protein
VTRNTPSFVSNEAKYLSVSGIIIVFVFYSKKKQLELNNCLECATNYLKVKQEISYTNCIKSQTF